LESLSPLCGLQQGENFLAIGEGKAVSLAHKLRIQQRIELQERGVFLLKEDTPFFSS